MVVCDSLVVFEARWLTFAVCAIMTFPVRRRIASSTMARVGRLGTHTTLVEPHTVPRRPSLQFSIAHHQSGTSVSSTLAPSTFNTIKRKITFGDAKFQPLVLDKTDSEATLCISDTSSKRPYSFSRCQTVMKDASYAERSCDRYARKEKEWTTFKWCLVWSVSSVFVYGTATLVCALLTWFRSKS